MEEFIINKRNRKRDKKFRRKSSISCGFDLMVMIPPSQGGYAGSIPASRIKTSDAGSIPAWCIKLLILFQPLSHTS